jgi:hypothetical protein
MNEKTAEEIRKEIREAVNAYCRACAVAGREIDRILTQHRVATFGAPFEVAALEACQQEICQESQKEGRKTLADYVRETGEYFGWTPATIQSQLSKVEADGCFQTSNKQIFDHLWWRVTKGCLEEETDSDFQADVYTPTETYCEGFGPILHRKACETEYTITDVGCSLRSPQGTSSHTSGRTGQEGTGHRGDPEARESVPTFLL